MNPIPFVWLAIIISEAFLYRPWVMILAVLYAMVLTVTEAFR